MSEIDELFAAARAGDPRAFAHWMGSVELPIRFGIRPYARAIDIETVLQETLLRMWVLTQDSKRSLTGENASLKFAIGIARNVARAEARRYRRDHLMPTEDLPEVAVPASPSPDHGMRQLIHDCLQLLAGAPLKAMEARLQHGDRFPDHAIAEMIRMTKNTFLQNVVRARRKVLGCLEKRGVRVDEVLS